MPWRNCSQCGRSYNDKTGGCTNKVCSLFDSGAVGASADMKANSPPSKPLQSTAGSVQTFVSKTAKPLTAPKFEPSSLLVSLPSGSTQAAVDAPILPWHETSTTHSGKPAPKGIEAKAEPFTLVCYRGEKSDWWPEPRMRLAAGGMNVFEPWPGKTIPEIWDKLVQEVKAQAGFTVKQKVAAYAQYLRAQGRPFALATARTKGGAFEGYAYELEIENARTFRWREDYTVGPPANFKDTQKITYEKMVNQNKETFTKDTIDADYIVLNADTLEKSTILGFGHKTGTYEVTFLHDIPLSFVKSVNGTAPNALNIYTLEQIQKLPDSDKKQTALKLFRSR